ncbi:MAG: hypothetical protein R2817_05095 [Flavobacteriales bacterium]
MRRSFAFILVLCVLVATSWTLFRWSRPDKKHSSPWRAIPERVAAVIIIPDGFHTWDRVGHTSQLWAGALQLPAALAVEDLLGRVKARMENDEALRMALSGGDVQVALLRNGGDELGCLFTGSLRGTSGEALRAVAEVLGLDATASGALAGGNVVQLQVDTALPTLSLCVRDGVWILGNSPTVMDEALLQWSKEEGLPKDSAFAIALRTLGGGSDGHLLFRGDRLSELAMLLCMPDAVQGVQMDDRWVAMDVRSKADMLLLSGLVPGPADRSPFRDLHSQLPGPDDGMRLLPRRAVSYRSWHISDPVAFLAERDSTGSLAEFYSWVQGSAGLAHAADSSGARWAILPSNDPDLARERLAGLCPNGCDTLSYRGGLLHRLPQEPMVHGFLKTLAAPWNGAWWTLLGNTVVLTDSEGALRESVDAWTDGRSLAEDQRSASWRARLGNEAGITWWTDMARTGTAILPFIRPAARASWDRATPFWKGVGNVSVHLNPGQRGSSHITVAVQFAPLQEQVQEQRRSERWSLDLKAPLSRTPQVVINHTNGTREVLVQDDLHRLHLIGSTGRILWTREMDGPILGRVHQIDRFRNDKLQLLFNTAGTIHLIDRNGRDVGGFPVKLPDPASAPLSVFDYDGNGDHRILVPLRNGEIDNRGSDGQRVKGWEAGRVGHSTASVEHLRIRTKDHLVLIDTSGVIRLMDRRGKIREQVPLKIEGGSTPLAIRPGLSLDQSSVLWRTRTGSIVRGTFHGEREVTGQAKDTSLVRTTGAEGPPMIVELIADSVILRKGSTRMTSIWLAGASEATNSGWRAFSSDAVFGLVLGGLLHLWTPDGSALRGAPFDAHGAWCLGDLDRDGLQELVVAEPEGRLRCLPVPEQ